MYRIFRKMLDGDYHECLTTESKDDIAKWLCKEYRMADHLRHDLQVGTLLILWTQQMRVRIPRRLLLTHEDIVCGPPK